MCFCTINSEHGWSCQEVDEAMRVYKFLNSEFAAKDIPGPPRLMKESEFETVDVRKGLLLL